MSDKTAIGTVTGWMKKKEGLPLISRGGKACSEERKDRDSQLSIREGEGNNISTVLLIPLGEKKEGKQS